jgi:hypothetical protein
MARRVTIVGFLLILVVAGGLVVTYLPRARLQANMATSQNNLRELGLFAAHHVSPDPKRDATRLPTAIPPGTVPLPDVPPDGRLSWAVMALGYIDQRKNPAADLLAKIDIKKPWAAEPNRDLSRTRLPVLTCPENPPAATPDGDAVTSYVGIGGVGPVAATLPPDSPKAGAFRYDAPAARRRSAGWTTRRPRSRSWAGSSAATSRRWRTSGCATAAPARFRSAPPRRCCSAWQPSPAAETTLCLGNRATFIQASRAVAPMGCLV